MGVLTSSISTDLVRFPSNLETALTLGITKNCSEICANFNVVLQTKPDLREENIWETIMNIAFISSYIVLPLSLHRY